jgi:hypothetical protein
MKIKLHNKHFRHYVFGDDPQLGLCRNFVNEFFEPVPEKIILTLSKRKKHNFIKCVFYIDLNGYAKVDISGSSYSLFCSAKKQIIGFLFDGKEIKRKTFYIKIEPDGI